MNSQSIRDLESEKEIWSGKCRVSRMWLGANVHTNKVLHLDLILMDSKGNDIWMAGKKGYIDILSDVVGQLHTHSEAITTTSLTLKTIRKEFTLQLIEGDVVKVVIWGRFIQRFDKIIDDHGDDQTILVISAVSVGEFKGELSFSSSGSTVVYRNLDIPAVKAFATGYRVQLEVQSDLKSAVFVLFEYEGKRYFGLTGHELFQKNGHNGDLPPDELLQLVGRRLYDSQRWIIFISIASGPASSQPSSDQSGQSATEKSIETPMDSDATPDNKLKRKMPLE
ncbi:unnamed protein product [Linum trigynum]|uniref:Uncharacterized protein n=1 Tax=Linum trigynum TaxID=586398 RepID=A0AAV2D6Z1_9ROSI